MPPAEPVLIVEDNDDTREALARILVLRGYRVVQSRDGQEAWEYLQCGGQACVIVLDLIMPILDGRLFRARQLAHTDTALIPVVVFTAVEGEEMPDVVGIVRKTNTDSLLNMIDRAASIATLTD